MRDTVFGKNVFNAYCDFLVSLPLTWRRQDLWPTLYCCQPLVTIETLWLYSWGAAVLSIFICSKYLKCIIRLGNNLTPTLPTIQLDHWHFVWKFVWLKLQYINLSYGKWTFVTYPNFEIICKHLTCELSEVMHIRWGCSNGLYLWTLNTLISFECGNTTKVMSRKK